MSNKAQLQLKQPNVKLSVSKSLLPGHKQCNLAKCYSYQYGTRPHIIVTNWLTPIAIGEVEGLSETNHVFHSIEGSAHT